MNIQQLELVERRRYSKLSGTRKYPKLNNLLTLYSPHYDAIGKTLSSFQIILVLNYNLESVGGKLS